MNAPAHVGIGAVNTFEIASGSPIRQIGTTINIHFVYTLTHHLLFQKKDGRMKAQVAGYIGENVV